MNQVLEIVKNNSTVRCSARLRKFIEVNNLTSIQQFNFSDFCNFNAVTEKIANELKDAFLNISKIDNFYYLGFYSSDIKKCLNR
ncbi:TPA: hypothetical protein LA460_000273 [Clostridium botulinum]|nr:hypothetical protein [Clostridium botulinum]HBJ1652877.1 hypothetical protein [Clostridium botulinum]